MNRLNNKGFAISGILYSLFVVFLLVLLSVLKGLQARRTLLEHSLLGLEETYIGKDVTNTNLNEAITTSIAPVTGKYIFNLQIKNEDGSIEEYSCSSYLKKGDKIDHSITLIPKDINNYTYRFSFETENNDLDELTLTKIYSFKE